MLSGYRFLKRCERRGTAVRLSMNLHEHHLRYRNQTASERTWTIHLIAAEKVVKATIILAVSVKLLTLIGQDVHTWAVELVGRHGIDIANHYVHDLLERLVGMNDAGLIRFSTVGFGYAALLYIEGIGLWMQKRWAEYLTAIGSALLIPVEIYEIFVKFTWVRVAILAINLFIVWYLITRLRDEKALHTASPAPVAN
jgi:uncharacterized membrane protein (DUF2068 family)